MNLLWLLLVSVGATGDLCPVPQEMDVAGKGVFRLLSGTPVVVADDATEAEVASLGVLFDALGFPLPVRRASEAGKGGAAVYVGEPGRHAGLTKRKVMQFGPVRDVVGAPEGYRLEIDKKSVVVAGSDPAGTFHGLETLAALAARSIELPCLTIRDYPDLVLRGVYVEGPLKREELARLAALKCNLALFRSDDFYALGANEAKWVQVFADARALHIEPVPVLDTLSSATLVALRPAVAEGQQTVDELVLRGDDWVRLTRRNVIATTACPIQVKVSGHVCAPKSDYAFEPGTLEAPFRTDAIPWLIRRVPGGAIPDGATVSVAYAYVPPGTTACCPAAPETKAVLQDVLGKLMAALHPRYVHVGHGAIERLNECARCREANKSNAAAFAASLALADSIVKKAERNARLMIWADAINPAQDAAGHDLGGAAPLLPKDTVVIVRDVGAAADGARRRAESLAWLQQTGLSFLGAAGARCEDAYAWCTALTGAGVTGVVHAGGDLAGPALACLMDKAWSHATPASAWGEALNAYLDASLWRPAYGDVLAAVAGYVNRQTLAGVRPEDHYEAFRGRAKTLRKEIPGAEEEIGLAETAYDEVVTYLELESAYNVNRQESALSSLVKLTQACGALNPEMDEERVGRIVTTIEGKGLFVPSTILFGQQLLPFRLVNVPADARALEVAVTPEYTDTERVATATYALSACPGPVYRVDFETVGTATLDVQRSDDGRAFASVQQWTSEVRGGVTGPAILERPFLAPFMRVSADAPAERAVLRNVRVFALKLPARVVCAYARTAPTARTGFDNVAWPESGRAEGFVRANEAVFAEAQTTVQVCRTRDALVVGVKAHEPRMRTMVATRSDRDAALWDEESFEMVLYTGRDEPFRFVVNPLGTQSDSRGGDAGWDGVWRVAARAGDAAWSAVLTIPFATLGGAPEKGAAWPVNFVRNRCNVHKERSAWDGNGDSRRPEDFGVVRFE